MGISDHIRNNYLIGLGVISEDLTKLFYIPRNQNRYCVITGLFHIADDALTVKPFLRCTESNFMNKLSRVTVFHEKCELNICH